MCCVPGSVLEAGGMAVNKTRDPCSRGADIFEEGQEGNKERTI